MHIHFTCYNISNMFNIKFVCIWMCLKSVEANRRSTIPFGMRRQPENPVTMHTFSIYNLTIVCHWRNCLSSLPLSSVQKDRNHVQASVCVGTSYQSTRSSLYMPFDLEILLINFRWKKRNEKRNVLFVKRPKIDLFVRGIIRMSVFVCVWLFHWSDFSF